MNLKDFFKCIHSKICYFVFSSFFENTILLLIIINAIILSLNGFLNENALIILEMNDTFTIIFIVEMILKLIALGVNDYVSDYFNVFDTAINIISFIDIISSPGANLGSVKVFRVLRVMRVLKMFRLIKYFSYMKIIISVL